MDLFFTILNKLLPLYLLIAFGVIVGKIFNIKGNGIGFLLIYILAPIVIFSGIAKMYLDLSLLALPFIFFFLCCFISLAAFNLGGKFLDSTTKNIFAFAVGSGNTGYFGLPIAVYLFDESVLGVAVLIAFGFILYENTVGFLIVAKSRHSWQKSLIKVICFPAVYAMIFGVIFNLAGYKLEPVWEETCTIFQKTYTILGMMLIGIGISQYAVFKPDFRLMGMAFFVKFLIWPITVLAFITVDSYFFRFLQPLTYQVMLLMSLVPLPANSVALATVLKVESKQIAATVFMSTLFALFYIPFFFIIGLTPH